MQDNWPERVSAMVAADQVGRATFTFLTEIVGLTRSEVETLHNAPGGRDVLPIVAATLPREAWALAAARPGAPPPPARAGPPPQSPAPGLSSSPAARPARHGRARSRESLPPHS